MDSFLASLIVAVLLIPVIGAVAYQAVKWLKIYFKYVEADGGFIDYLVICLCMLFAAVKVAQFIGSTFAGVQY